LPCETTTGEALQARVTDRRRLAGRHRVGVGHVQQRVVGVIQDPHAQLTIARGRRVVTSVTHVGNTHLVPLPPDFAMPLGAQVNVADLAAIDSNETVAITAVYMI
jgi:hypothetical protein